MSMSMLMFCGRLSFICELFVLLYWDKGWGKGRSCCVYV